MKEVRANIANQVLKLGFSFLLSIYSMFGMPKGKTDVECIQKHF